MEVVWQQYHRHETKGTFRLHIEDRLTQATTARFVGEYRPPFVGNDGEEVGRTGDEIAAIVGHGAGSVQAVGGPRCARPTLHIIKIQASSSSSSSSSSASGCRGSPGLKKR